MELVEISYHDYLAQCANGIFFDNWFTHDWCNFVLTYCMKGQYAEKVDNTIHINENFTFIVGDDLIELVDGVFEIEPHTQIIPPVEGRLTTLVMISTFKVKGGRIKGNICVRNPTQDPINAKYELSLKNVEVKGIVGLEINGDGFTFNHSVYKYSNPEISFFFIKEDSEKESIFDKVIDINQQAIFKNYILDYFMKDVTRAIEEFQFCRLSIKQTVSELCGNDYALRNVLRIHNKKLHLAFNNLAKEIMRLTNEGVKESLIELQLNKMYGLILGENDVKKLEVYKGMLYNLDMMELPYRADVIVSNDNEVVIAYVPIVFSVNVKYTDYTEEESGEEVNYKHDEVYKTTRSYFTMSLKKLDDGKIEIDLLDMKIESFEKGRITLDFSITSVMEDVVKPYLEQAVKHDSLQQLADNPEVELDYDDDDYFETEDSDEDMSED